MDVHETVHGSESVQPRVTRLGDVLGVDAGTPWNDSSIMRQLRLLALLAPALLLLPVVACEDSSSSPAAAFTFEAGPGFEAGPPAEAGPLPDGGGADADVDAFVPPVVPKGVSVTVVDALLVGKANVRVISHDATGAVIGDQKTDATGKLTIATAPSAVTVLTTTGSSVTPVTYFAVADGDKLVVRLQSGVLVDPSPVGQYSVTFTPPAVAPVPTATVVVGNGCGGSSPDTSMPLVVALYPSCIGAANAVLASGFDVNGGFAGFAFKKGVAKPAASATDPVTLPGWAAAGQTTLDAVNRPAGANSLSGSLYMIANGAAFQANGSGALGDGGQSYATATGFAEAYQSFVRAGSFAMGASDTAIVRRSATTAPASLALPNIDMAAALPFITATAVDSTTPARPSVTITSGALTAADGGFASITWLDATDSLGTWTFVLPASATATFKVPALPADAAAFAPLAPTNVQSVVFVEATQIPSYTEIKALPVTPRAQTGIVDGSIPLPIDGTARITTWGPG
jgi:hypothetical protein